MPILDDYLKYLNEGIPVGALSKAGGFLGKEVAGGLKFTAAMAAATTTLKGLNLAFSKATRNCGGGIFKKQTPGFKICVARERIKILQQKMTIYKNILLKCKEDANPKMCQQKYNIEIEKVKNRILINQNKIKSLLGEQAQIIPALAKVGTVAAGMAAMMALDKAIFLANRTTLAAVSKSSRKCGIYKDGSERDLCISKIKLAGLNLKLTKMKSIIGNCSKEKNPIKCKEKVNKHINKAIRDIQILKDSITVYKNEVETQKREERLKAAMKAQDKTKRI